MGDPRVERNKRALRRRFRQVRSELGEERRAAADEGIKANLLALPAYGRAKVLLAYLDFGTEVRTRGIIEAAWAAGKTVVLPRCVEGTREMEWYRIESFEGLVRSPLGVLEPMRSAETLREVGCSTSEFVVVPALTFDRHGYRLGYGGGYYDAFLKGFPGTKAGLCRSCQLSRDLRAEGAIESHDLPVDVVVTDEGVLFCS